MKKSFLWLLSGLVMMSMSGYFYGCHNSHSNGGGGGGGAGGVQTSTSGFAKGVITAKGTIVVNNVEYDTTGAAITANGSTATEQDLQTGQVVSLIGTVSGATGTASQVVYMSDLTGPLSAVTGTLASFGTMTATIMGQTVIIDSRTKLSSSGTGSQSLASSGTGSQPLSSSGTGSLTSLTTGSVFEVSGLPDSTGAIHASFIQSKATSSTYNVRGFVTSGTGSVSSGPTTSTFTLAPTINGGTELSITLGTGATLPADFANGKLVNVIIDSATVIDMSATNFTAKSVTVEKELLPAEGDKVSIEGFSTAPTGTAGGANGFDIDGFPVNPGTIQMPVMDTKVIVIGTLTNNVINADTIELADTSNFAIGPLSSLGTVSGATGTNMVFLNGSAFDISSAQIKVNGAPGSMEDLEAGKQAIIKSAVTLSTGSTGTSGLGSGGTGTSGVGSGGTGTTSTGVQQVACPASGTTDVTIQDFLFTPSNVSVTANTTVKWTNNGPSVHTVTSAPGQSASFNSGNIAPGTSVCFSFPDAGNFNYFCSIHPFMIGSVTVQGGGAGGGGAGGGGGGVGSGGTGTTGVASALTTTANLVWIVDNMTGPISSTSVSLSTSTTGSVAPATFDIFGQHIQVNEKTKIGKNLKSGLTGSSGLLSLGTGSVVNVSGTSDGAGNLLATFIDSQPTATMYHVLGIVSNVTGSSATNFTVTPDNGTPLTVTLTSSATGSSPTVVSEGQLVDVKVLPSAFANPTSTDITAQSVDIVDQPKPGETDQVNVEGIVSNLTGTGFTVNDIDVDTSGMAGGMPAGLTTGNDVRVQGTVSQGVLKSEQIDVRS